MQFKWLIGFYLLTVIIFTFFSYSQIDLNLTLSANYYYQIIQQQLIQLGYYQRLLATGALLLILVILFGFYIWALKRVGEKKLTFKQIKWLVVVTSLLIFAYPAFSHDLFNYMFDARIVTSYGLDPSFFKALDFPLDPWTRFMRWTHRYYPYGPGWLLLTLIPSFLGMGKFVLTLFLFKLMFLAFHLANVWLIREIGGKEKKWTAVVFYGLNPLILIESLVSPHNEIVMLTGVLLAIYLLQKQKVFVSALALVASISIKFVSLVLVPLFIFKKNLDQRFFHYLFWLWVVALVPVIAQREPYSWYLIPLVALVALIDSITIKILIFAASASLLSRYLPFFLYGDYGTATVQLQWWLMWGVLGILGITGVILSKKGVIQLKDDV